MAKVHYVHGRYRDAQGMCARVSIEELTQAEQPVYHLRLLAEAFAIKGTACCPDDQDYERKTNWVSVATFFDCLIRGPRCVLRIYASAITENTTQIGSPQHTCQTRHDSNAKATTQRM